MKIKNQNPFSIYILLISCLILSCNSNEDLANIESFPKINATDISPDTHLKLTFKTQPVLGNSGKIQVFDKDTDSLVDLIDMSIPAGPTEPNVNPEADYTPIPYTYVEGKFTNANTLPGTPSGVALPNKKNYQLTIIGGFTDAFHFYPILVKDQTATIYLHHNLLDYSKTYYVLMDSTVLSTEDGSFKGIYDKETWQFTTRETGPNLATKKLVVDGTGNGDFNTVQGALDYIPSFHNDTIEIEIKNGVYEELIYFRNKSNIIIKGEEKENVIIQYANNEVFNPHPWNVKTNEWPGTFPSRRAAFAMDNCANIQLYNLTIKNLLKGQAEGLLINGSKNVVKNVHIVGDGDALQTNGTAYFQDVSIDGGGDMILGRGPAFFKNCDFISPGPFMWIRNTDANHGNVFVNCSFTGTREQGSELARAPTNKGIYSYPFSEAVLINCKLKNIVPKGWGVVGGDKTNIHYWEYNSTNLDDEEPIDTSQRADFSRQLTLESDKELIENYSKPSFVLQGWQPNLRF